MGCTVSKRRQQQRDVAGGKSTRVDKINGEVDPVKPKAVPSATETKTGSSKKVLDVKPSDTVVDPKKTQSTERKEAVTKKESQERKTKTSQEQATQPSLSTAKIKTVAAVSDDEKEKQSAARSKMKPSHTLVDAAAVRKASAMPSGGPKESDKSNDRVPTTRKSMAAFPSNTNAEVELNRTTQDNGGEAEKERRQAAPPPPANPPPPLAPAGNSTAVKKSYVRRHSAPPPEKPNEVIVPTEESNKKRREKREHSSRRDADRQRTHHREQNGKEVHGQPQIEPHHHHERRDPTPDVFRQRAGDYERLMPRVPGPPPPLIRDDEFQKELQERLQARQRFRTLPTDPEDDTLFELPARMPVVNFT